MNENFISILRELFHDAGNFDAEDFLHVYGDPRQALLSSVLFFPRLVEVEGMVLLERVVHSSAERSQVKRLLQEYRGNKALVETQYNSVEISYTFSSRSLSDNGEFALAHIVADAWRAWIPFKFPGRRFSVEVVEPEVSGSVFIVRFYEIR